MENQFNYNMSAMPLCWPTYILRHFLDILQPIRGCLEVTDVESAKCKKKLRLATKRSQNKTTTGHLARPRPRLCLSSHSLAGRRLPRPHPLLPESTSWLVFVISVFLCLFDLTSLEILIDSQLNIIANWLKGFKRFNCIIFTFARSRSQNGCQ